MHIDDWKLELERLIDRDKFYSEPITREAIEDLLNDFPEDDELYEDYISKDEYEALEEREEELEGLLEESEAKVLELEERLENENI